MGVHAPGIELSAHLRPEVGRQRPLDLHLDLTHDRRPIRHPAPRVASGELDGRSRSDLECLASLRVGTRSGRTRTRAERAEPDQLNRIALDRRVRHRRQKYVDLFARLLR